MALNLIFMGPPGAGKGTQADRFARERGIPKISTGDILRDEVAAGSALGEQVKARLASGELVGDELIVEIVRERLWRSDALTGFVLDGFPRTVPQAVALDQMLSERDPLVVVEIRVPDGELVRRVINRRLCSKCGRTMSAFDGSGQTVDRCTHCGGQLVSRADDTEAVVRDRLKVYWRETQPMIAYYHSRPTYRVVDGAQTPERVRADLVQVVANAEQYVASTMALSAKPGDAR